MIPSKDENGHTWTVLSSHIYLERRVDELKDLLLTQIKANAVLNEQRSTASKEAVGIAMDAARAAVAKAEVAQEKRLEGMNEFRETLTQQAATFVTNDKLQSEMKLIESKIQTSAALLGQTDNRVGTIEGRGEGSKAVIGYVIGAAGLFGGLIVAVVNFLVVHK